MFHKENQDIGLARRIPSKLGRLSIPTLGIAETPETSDYTSIKD